MICTRNLILEPKSRFHENRKIFLLDDLKAQAFQKRTIQIYIIDIFYHNKNFQKCLFSRNKNCRQTNSARHILVSLLFIIYCSVLDFMWLWNEKKSLRSSSFFLMWMLFVVIWALCLLYVLFRKHFNHDFMPYNP